MAKKLELNYGERRGNLVLIAEGDGKRLPSGQINRTVICLCNCGKTKEIRLAHWVRDRIESCGCSRPNHGESGTRLHNTWRAIKMRTKKNYHERKYYYDRGIKMFGEWRRSFIDFRDYAMSIGYKDGLQIDRIDNNKGYFPGNIRFVTASENGLNKRTTKMIQYNGETTPLLKALRQRGVESHYSTIMARINRGWDDQRAVDTPVRQGNYRRNE